MTDLPALDQQIADLEHRLVDFHERPRVAQIQRVDERTAMENKLADLRQQRNDTTQHAGDEPDAA